MNKTVKNLLRILYFLFTFGLGLLLALTLPGIYSYEAHPKFVNKYLQENDFTKVFNLTDAYFYDTPSVNVKFENGTGLVMVPGTTTYQKTIDGVNKVIVHEVYSCYFYNVPKTFEHQKVENNQTSLKIHDNNGNEFVYSNLLNYSSDGSDKKEAISSLLVYPYIYFEIPKSNDLEKTEINNISNIVLTDCYGKEFINYTIDGDPLTYDHQFFKDIDEFVTTFNQDSTQTEKLKELQSNFLNKDSKYQMGGTEFQKITQDSNKRAVIWVLVYFILVYVFFDLILGPRYIIKFFVLIYTFIKKKIHKEDKDNEVDPYGTDYYSNLKLTVSLPENVNDDIFIKFKNADYSYEAALNVFNKYETNVRVHAGKYYGLVVKSNLLELEEPITEFKVQGYVTEMNFKLKEKLDNKQIEKEKANENYNSKSN